MHEENIFKKRHFKQFSWWRKCNATYLFGLKAKHNEYWWEALPLLVSKSIPQGVFNEARNPKQLAKTVKRLSRAEGKCMFSALWVCHYKWHLFTWHLVKTLNRVALSKIPRNNPPISLMVQTHCNNLTYENKKNDAKTWKTAHFFNTPIYWHSWGLTSPTLLLHLFTCFTLSFLWPSGF